MVLVQIDSNRLKHFTYMHMINTFFNNNFPDAISDNLYRQ